MILRRFRLNSQDRSIRDLYGAIVAQARAVAFYSAYGVPDTVEGRFDLIVLHIVLVLARLDRDGSPVRGIGQKLFDQFPAKGIVGLCWGHWGWRPVTHTKKAVPHPEDIAGTKIRVQPGAIYAATYQQLGAPPTVIDVSEIYLALSQGAVDALEVPLISLIASKFYEVAKHVSNVNFVYNAGAIMGSKKTMDKLPPEFQKAVLEAAQAVSPSWRTMMAEKTDEAIVFLKSQGCTIDDVDKAAYAKALQPVWTQYKPIVGADLVDAIQKQIGRA